MVSKKILTRGILLTLFTSLILIYKFYDPLSIKLFPRCPFNVITGFLCPGCGSQRSVHHLLNLNIAAATSENMLLVFSIPYIMTGFTLDVIKSSGPIVLKWRRILFGRNAIFLILAFICTFWIIRNLNQVMI